MNRANVPEGAGSHKWRPVGPEAIMAEQCQANGFRGVVAAAAPTAALIGAEILRAGGNAFDAVVAAALAETVLLPPKCGLAGDLIALAWRCNQPAPEALLAIGGAARGLAAAALSGALQETGPTSVGVPGAPAGYLALAERGRLPLENLAKPAILLAREGYAWSRVCSLLAEDSKTLVARHNPNGTIYYPGGNVIRPGAIVKLDGMAKLLEEFVLSRHDFLSGKVGDAIVARVQAGGGVITHADLAQAYAEWAPALSGNLAGMPLFATPAPTHGPSLMDAVSRLEKGIENPAIAVLPYVRLAIEKRRAALADPSGTSMVSAVDLEGTMVCVIHSNSFPKFGSGLVVEDYDLILSNRAGRGFSSDPNHPNFPVAGRRPASTLHAWGLRNAEGKRILGATPGGANQMPWNAQTLARFAGGEQDIGRLIVAPRWEWRPADDSFAMEAGFDEIEKSMMANFVPNISFVDRWALRSAMQIVARDDATGAANSAADPRTVGMALAL